MQGKLVQFGGRGADVSSACVNCDIGGFIGCRHETPVMGMSPHYTSVMLVSCNNTDILTMSSYQFCQKRT